MTSESPKTKNRLDQKKNNRLLIFFICLLFATALWFIKAMEKNYVSDVMLPVQYINIPRNNILVNPPPKKLNVKIRSTGFSLLRHRLGLRIAPINLDIKPFAPNIPGGKFPQFIIISDLFIPQISDQISLGISVLDVSPDTLYFHYDYLTEKRVKVISKVEIDCENQFFISDSLKITPSHVTVRGPVSIIDTLSGIATTAIKFNNLSAPVHTIVSLYKIEQLEFSVNKVSIEIPVSQFTEYKEKISIHTFNVPAGIKFITFPVKADLSCLIAYDKFKSMKIGDFEIGVDYNDITPNSNTLPVKIIKQPDFIKSLKIQPLQVEYIIKKK